MTQESINNRYIIDSFHSKSLEGNPLGTTADRDINVYLPPGYFDDNEKRYPVIYFLHGYGGHNRSWNMTSKDSEDSSDLWNLIPKKYLKEIDVEKLLYFEKLDDLITSGELAPFILVQPDGSLHAPHKDGALDFKRKPILKGSFYVNSPHVGNYRDYIINDVIEYIDNKYRTLSDRNHRAIMGGSMGGYGTLNLAIHHPEKFIAAVSLSPGDLGARRLYQVKLRIPLVERIFGEKLSIKLGDSSMDDILDTIDLIMPGDSRKKYDMNQLIREHPESFKKVHLFLSCDLDDEFKLAEGVAILHDTLNELDVPHEYDLSRDSKAALTPHGLGIGYKMIPGIIFCQKYFS